MRFLAAIVALSVFGADPSSQSRVSTDFSAQKPLKQGQAKRTGAKDLRSEIEQALRRSALDDFSGTVTFLVEGMYRPMNSADSYYLQSWKIHTDNVHNISAEVSWPATEQGTMLSVGESQRRRWMAGLNSELLVWDKEIPPESPTKDENHIMLMSNLINQARHQVDWLLGATAARGSTIDFVLMNRDQAHPSAVVKISGETRSASFIRVDGTLLPQTISRDDGVTTYRWTFAGYRRVGNRWVPGSARFVELRDHAQPKVWSYSEIVLAPNEGGPEFRKNFRVPDPSDADFRSDILITKTFTGRYPGQPSRRIDGRPNFQRLKTLNAAERAQQ